LIRYTILALCLPFLISLQIFDVIDELQLSHVSDSKIGSPDSGGISGGERRRVALGKELLADPGVLLLDEVCFPSFKLCLILFQPTSGLDSFNAEVIVQVVQNAVRKRNCACVMTVHQVTLVVFVHTLDNWNPATRKCFSTL
jgi:ABC-type multidrug transport system ATPase subunit